MSSTGLPRQWRIQVYNDTGVASGGNIEVTARYTKTDSSGLLIFDAETVLRAAATLAINTADESSTQDNETGAEEWTGIDGIIDANITTATPDGNIELWFQASTDGGTTWPTDRSTTHDGSSFLVATLNFTTQPLQLIGNWSV